MSNKISAKLTLFILAIKNSNTDRGITFDDFLTELRLLNKGRISRYEFLKFVQRINRGGSSFDAMQIFNQLAPDEDSLPVATLQALYVKLARLSNQRLQNPKEKQYQQQMEEQEKNKKLAKIGFERLLKYVNSKSNIDPIQLFNDCDQDGSGDIDMVELNKFLLASEIDEFRDKTIRRQVINDIFAKFPTGKIKKDDFFNLFQLPKQKSKKPDVSKIPSNGFLNPEDSNSPADDINKGKNIRIKAKKAVENPPEQLKQKPQEAVNKERDRQINQKQYFQAYKQVFPQASSYYRLGVPSTDDLSLIEELQQMLKQNTIYKDENNPLATGNYIYANQIFKQQKYQLIAMTASAIYRNKGKKEIAQYIEAKDIKQGQVGDCYFMSAVSSLASSYPQLLSERFIFEINPSHFYGVRLFIDGQWRTYKTDDRFACLNGEPVCAKPNANEIWVMLLEKAFAKVFGSYAAIQSGNMQESFFILTGAPQEIINIKTSQRETIMRRIFQGKEKGYIMGTSGNEGLSKMGKAAHTQLGLVGNHAYSLISIHKVGSDTLLKLRNPWGHTVWKGAWSFESREWTPELRKQLQSQANPNDGSFFMSWKDYEKYFGTINICQLNPIYLHTSLRMNNNCRKSNYVQMKVTTSGAYSIFICQQNQRKFQPKRPYSNARLIITRKTESGSFEYIGSQGTQLNQLCIVETTLEKGTYLLSAKLFWKEWTNHQCCLTAYGPERVAFEKADRTVATHFKDSMLSSFAKIMKNNASVSSFESYGYKNVLQEVLTDLKRGIGYIKTINKSSKDFHCKMNLTMKGMKIIKPKQTPYQFHLTPGKQDIIGFFLSAGGFTYSKSQSFWH